MQRGSVFADLRLGGHWRGFAQLASSFTNGRAAGPSPVDENRLDPTNLFVEWQSARDGETGVGMRVGVQELQFGSGRSIDAREGPNVRRSFEAVRAYTTSGSAPSTRSTRAVIISATKRRSGRATSPTSIRR